VGLTEAEARATHDVVTTVMPFDSAVRAILEGRTLGFCKLVVDRASFRILGCHVVGERAVEIAQLAAISMTAQMPVDELGRVAISFPTYAEVLVYAAVRAAIELGLPLGGRAEHLGAQSSGRGFGHCAPVLRPGPPGWGSAGRPLAATLAAFPGSGWELLREPAGRLGCLRSQ
jgi:hypothetical protein